MRQSEIDFSDLDWQGPTFGSVFNASSIGFFNVRDVFTSVDGGHVDLTVSRSDGSRLFIDGSVRELTVGTETLDLDDYSYSYNDNYFWDGWAYFKNASGEITVDYDKGTGTVSAANIAYTYDMDDSSNYVAFGYWLDSKIQGTDPFITGLELGIFAEGTDFESAAVLPVSGTATYTGDFTGMYLHANEQNTILTSGNYSADIKLEANFGNNTISGCVGCGNSTFYDLEVLNLQGIREIAKQDTDLIMRLRPTPLNTNGEYTGNVIIESTTRRITPTDGEYAGRMSIVDVDGTIGTVYAGFRDSNGEGGIGGAYYATIDE